MADLGAAAFLATVGAAGAAGGSFTSTTLMFTNADASMALSGWFSESLPSLTCTVTR